MSNFGFLLLTLSKAPNTYSSLFSSSITYILVFLRLNNISIIKKNRPNEPITPPIIFELSNPSSLSSTGAS